MKKARKLALTFMSVLFALTFVLGLAACGGQSAKDAIAAYLLPQDNQLVDADFTLPKAIGIDNGVKVTWTSNNEAIKIEDGPTEDTYTAKVTLQDEVTPVKLTIASGGASKDFTVRVDELSVFTFINHYGNDDYDKNSFPQRKTAQKEDFTLDSSYSIQGKTATIVWEAEAGQTYLVIDSTTTEGVQKAIVTPGDDLVKVKLTATFTYKGVSKDKEFEISISPILDHRQNVVKLYSEGSFPIEFEGYVVHVYVAEDGDYGPMASFYAVDSDFCSGYYIWQAGLESAADVAKVKVGAHFTFSGDVTKNYNGLWESNGYEDGTAVFDGEGNKTEAEMEAAVRAFDDELVSGIDSARWQMSRLVSLSGWKVNSAATDDDKGNTHLTLKNGNTTINVYTSTYVTTASADMTALKTALNALTTDDYVNIKGILGYNNSYRLQPRTAADITKVTEAGTNNGAKLKAAYNAVKTAIEESGFDVLVRGNKTNVQMPVGNIQNAAGVTVSYRLARAATTPAPVTVNETNGQISVAPISEDRSCLIEVNYKIADKVVAQSVFTIRSWKTTDQNIVDEVATNLNKTRINAIKNAGEYDLPEVDKIGTTIEWTIGDASDPDSQPEWATIDADNEKLVISYLPMKATSLKVYAQVRLGNAESEKVFFNVKVSAVPDETFSAIESATAGDYIFALYQGTLEEWQYSAGTITTNSSGNFGATVTDSAKAAVYTLAQGTTGWTIKLKSAGTATNVGKYLELDSNHRLCYVAAPTKDWVWDATYKVFKFTVDNDGVYYIGNYDTFNTFSASKESFLSNSENYVAHFGTMVKATPATRAAEIADKCILDRTVFAEETQITLFHTKQYDADIAYSLADAATQITLTNGTTESTLHITLPTSGTVTATLKIDVTVGESTAHREVTIKVLKLSAAGTEDDPFTVDDVLTLGRALPQGGYYSKTEQYYVTGVVVANGGWSASYGNFSGAYIAASMQAADRLQVYRLSLGEALTDASQFNVSAEVVVKGFIQNYSGNPQVTYVGSTNPTLISYDGPTAPPTTVPQKLVPIEAPQSGSTYYLAMKVGDNYNYITGSMVNSYYFGTTQDTSQAKQVTVTESETDGWIIKYDTKFVELSISGQYYNPKYNASQTSGKTWKWDATNKVFVWTHENVDYILGNTGTFTNISGIKLSDKASSNYAVLGTLGDMNDEEKAQYAANAAKATLEALDLNYAVPRFTFPTSTVTGVTLSYKINDAAVSGAYELTHTEQETTLTIAITATSGADSNTVTKTATATVKVGRALTAGTGNLTLTKASITKIIANGSATAYATYNGVHDATGGYAFYTSQVMQAKDKQGGEDAIQIQSNSKTKLAVKGNFTKVTVVFVSPNVATHDSNKLVVKANGVVCTAGTATTTQSSDGTKSLHTVEFTITGSGVQEITIEKTANGTAYVKSIAFTAAT